MDLENLESDLEELVSKLNEESFIFDLLLAYGHPKSTITRLKKGDYNQSKTPGEILWKKHLYFVPVVREELFTRIDEAKNSSKIKRHRTRFLVVTDFRTLLAIDTRTSDTLDVKLVDLPKYANFFLPWAGMEKSAITSENPADIKAAEKMGQLYDLLLHNNEVESEKSRHALNVFLSRLLFCFFAEDTGIFDDDQFTKLVDSHTIEDGSNLQALLERLFKALNAEYRSDYPEYIRAFPYVNGGLFADDLPVPAFSRKSRKMLIDCGALNWQAINPDIFGSMMQAVTLGEERSNIGMHYTSVVNIMKVIEPLFLNCLQEQLEKADGNEKQLEKLLDRLYHIRIFDPACGSGNFLIIAYKELCRIEISIFQQLQELNPSKWSVARSGIQLNQFYGIEIDDFATETAKLSLWLAEHQMNLDFEAVFGESRPTLPLTESGNILAGNATRLDWEDVCAKEPSGEIYILGNPPYFGGKYQSKQQKADLAYAFSGLGKCGELDYVSCWIVNAAKYIENTSSRFCFVATSSVCQGAQVHQLWPHIFNRHLEILFAYKPFIWANSAKANAKVMCSIIAVSSKSRENKFLYDGENRLAVKSISPYLLPGSERIIFPRKKSISKLPKLITGNSAYDGGNLLLSELEKQELLAEDPRVRRYVRMAFGSKDFLNGPQRWCLWIGDDELEGAMRVPDVARRIENVRAFRKAGGDVARGIANRPHQFRYTHVGKRLTIIVPRTSSARRAYLPVGFLDQGAIVLDSAQAIYDPEPWVFGVLTSRMHNVWFRVMAGRLKGDVRYSSELCYNTFPFPRVNNLQKCQLEERVFLILDARERNSEKSLSELYDPEKMPEELYLAHQDLDQLVESIYRPQSFESDSNRLEYMFLLYGKMLGKKQERLKIA